MKLNIPLGNVGYGNQLFIIGGALRFSELGIKVRIISHLKSFDSVPTLLGKTTTEMKDLGGAWKNISIENFRKFSTLGFYKYFIVHYPFAKKLIAIVFRFKKSKGYEADIQLISRNRVRILDGWFQDFRPLKFIQSDYIDASKCLEKSPYCLALEECLKSPTLGIHIRRGDFLRHLDSFGVLSFYYYREALGSLNLERYRQVIIFSDDTMWCRQQDWNGLDINFIGSEELSSVQETHFLMGNCAALICSNSTFSLSAAFLWGVPEVVVPETLYFDAKSDNTLSRSYPKNWRQISSQFELF